MTNDLTFIKIDVSTKRYPNKFALIDSEDFEKVKNSKFSYTLTGKTSSSKTFYCSAIIKQKGVRLHRLIMNAQKGQIVDHINRDTLDNRKSNLRFVTRSQNNLNVIRNKQNDNVDLQGVYLQNSKYQLKKPYKSSITINGKTKYLGTFATKEEAHENYIREAIKLKGEFMPNVL